MSSFKAAILRKIEKHWLSLTVLGAICILAFGLFMAGAQCSREQEYKNSIIKPLERAQYASTGEPMLQELKSSLTAMENDQFKEIKSNACRQSVKSNFVPLQSLIQRLEDLEKNKELDKSAYFAILTDIRMVNQVILNDLRKKCYEYYR